MGVVKLNFGNEQHLFLSKVYGPGEVEVNSSIASILIENHKRVTRSEEHPQGITLEPTYSEENIPSHETQDPTLLEKGDSNPPIVHLEDTPAPTQDTLPLDEEKEVTTEETHDIEDEPNQMETTEEVVIEDEKTEDAPAETTRRRRGATPPQENA